MSRHPRGNQHAIVGGHRLQLCPVCDAEAIAAAEHGTRLVPEAYVSRFMVSASLAPVGDQTTPAAPSSVGQRREEPDRPPTPANTQEPQPDRAMARRPQPPVGSTGRAANLDAPGPEDPTVRQAMERFLTDHGRGVDPTVVLLLGGHLQPATPLSSLGDADADKLAGWFTRTWSGAARGPARATVLAVVEFWRRSGWLTFDPAHGLRDLDQ